MNTLTPGFNTSSSVYMFIITTVTPKKEQGLYLSRDNAIFLISFSEVQYIVVYF